MDLIPRRRFLMQSGKIVASTSVMARMSLARVSAHHAQPRIAIVGAGIAGLTAALTLTDAGFACTVYEASARIGGRMHSERNLWKDEQISEWGGEFIDSDHVTMHALIKRFGLALIDLAQHEDPQAKELRYFSGSYYSTEQFYRDLLPVLSVIQRQANLLPDSVTWQSANTATRELDHMSLYTWIERFVPGGHRAPLGALLEVAFLAIAGIPTQEQSALNLISVLGEQSLTSFNLTGTSDERYRIRGGNQQLPLAIAASLPLGTLQHQWFLESVGQSHSTANLTFSTPNGSHHIRADHVILALPFSVLRRLDYRSAGFDARKVLAIQTLGYGTQAKLAVQFHSRYWHGPGIWPGKTDGTLYTDTGPQVVWDTTIGQPGTSGILVNLHAGPPPIVFHPYTTSLTSQVQHYAHAFLAHLDGILPHATQQYTGAATLSVPARDPYLLGTYSSYRVGQVTAFSGYEHVRQGTIHFAGEHTSLTFPGYMEGAAESGIRSAQEIIALYQ